MATVAQYNIDLLVAHQGESTFHEKRFTVEAVDQDKAEEKAKDRAESQGYTVQDVANVEFKL